MYREFIDSREAFDAMTREEYNDYLDQLEEDAVLARQEAEEDDDYELDDFEHDFAPEDDYEDDGQPTMYEEYQDLYGGDDSYQGYYD